MKLWNKLLFYLIPFTIFYACKDDSSEMEVPFEDNNSFEKSIGGAADDLANSIVAKDNHLFILGQSKSFNEPNGDHYLIKLDVNGDIIFEKTYGGILSEEGIKIIATNDGNLILVGYTESFGNGQRDIHVLKVGDDGAILWEKYFGGPLNDQPIDIIETTNGDFCIAATTESFGAGARDIYLVWIDQNGNLIRHKTYGGSDIDGSSAILEIENEELIVYGYTRNFGANNRDLYLMKLNAIGDSLWSMRYGGNGYEESQGFARTSSGGYLLNGHSSSVDPNHNMYAVEVDIDGNQIWENNYGGELHDGGQALTINNKGNYAFLARSISFGNGDRDLYLVTTNSKGDIISENVIGGSGDDWGQDILAYQSHYFIVGHSNSFSTGDNDVYLIKLRQ